MQSTFSDSDGKPSLSHGTLVIVPLLTKGSLFFEKEPQWGAYIEEINANRITVQVNYYHVSTIDHSTRGMIRSYTCLILYTEHSLQDRQS
jgi:hypothetical protein